MAYRLRIVMQGGHVSDVEFSTLEKAQEDFDRIADMERNRWNRNHYITFQNPSTHVRLSNILTVTLEAV